MLPPGMKAARHELEKALLLAAKNGDLAEVERLAAVPVDVNCRDEVRTFTIPPLFVKMALHNHSVHAHSHTHNHNHTTTLLPICVMFIYESTHGHPPHPIAVIYSKSLRRLINGHCL